VVLGHLGAVLAARVMILAALGRPWGGLGVSWAGLGCSWAAMGRSWDGRRCSGGALGPSCVVLGALLAALEGLFLSAFSDRT